MKTTAPKTIYAISEDHFTEDDDVQLMAGDLSFDEVRDDLDPNEDDLVYEYRLVKVYKVGRPKRTYTLTNDLEKKPTKKKE